MAEMENVTDTWIAAPKKVTNRGVREACLIHIYPTGPAMGNRFNLNAPEITVGRGEENQIQIPDPSVSRRHARITSGLSGFAIQDLQSTNGTFVNDQPISESSLQDGDYLRVGNCIFRFLAGGNVESEYHEEIYRLTIIDGLTQIHNQRYMMDFLERELARSARHQRPLALVLFDIDFFKAVNDDMGHLAGDYTLRELVKSVHSSVRREDLFARYGGEEFALVLVETSLESAIEVAERIRVIVENLPLKFEDHDFKVTISLGIGFTPGEEGLTAPAMIRQADEKLFQAKRGGRNRIVH